ncbi:MAG: 50S ribosomal protein L29 [Dehalococcoidia bacterium]|nr:50S ribosomal protein L29 [Dehalococcoidia bacterium]
MRITDIRELETGQLHKELKEQERALMNLRFRKATLQLSDPSEIRKTRETVARIRTVIRERQITAEIKKKSNG